MESIRSFLKATRFFAVVLALLVAALPAVDSLESRVCLEIDGEEAVDQTLDQKASSPAPLPRRSSRRGARALPQTSLPRAVASSHRRAPTAVTPPPPPIALTRPLRC